MKILIIGSGYISGEYLKVITHLGISCTVVGRGNKNLELLKNDFPQVQFYSGGLEKFVSENTLQDFSHFINLVNIRYCSNLTQVLVEHGAKYILLEKPGGLNLQELSSLKLTADDSNAGLWIGYNRRFYQSVERLKLCAQKDGGIDSIHFEFTEWIHKIDTDKFSNEELQKWIISNSSHVLDTAFHLIGIPRIINPLIDGRGQISWHSSGAVFVGCGVSMNDIPFSYNTNWSSAGRWALEISTKQNRYFLSPMEKLFLQRKGEIKVEEVSLPEDIDRRFKPGLYNLISSYLKGDTSLLLSIDEQIEHVRQYNLIGGYD